MARSMGVWAFGVVSLLCLTAVEVAGVEDFRPEGIASTERPSYLESLIPAGVEDFFPEGIASTKRGIYLSIGFRREVILVDPESGGAKILPLKFPQGTDPVFGSLGLHAIKGGKFLLAAQLDSVALLTGASAPKTPELLLINLKTLKATPIAVTGAIMLNDVTFDWRNAAAYATDTAQGKIFRIRRLFSSEPVVELFADSRCLLMGIPGEVGGINGIEFHPSFGIISSVFAGTESRLIVAKASKYPGVQPQLFKTQLVTMDWQPFPVDPAIGGFDGIFSPMMSNGKRDPRQLIVTASQQILRLYSTDGFVTARVIETFDVDPAKCLGTATSTQIGNVIHSICTQGFAPGPYPIVRFTLSPLEDLLA